MAENCGLQRQFQPVITDQTIGYFSGDKLVMMVVEHNGCSRREQWVAMGGLRLR